MFGGNLPSQVERTLSGTEMHFRRSFSSRLILNLQHKLRLVDYWRSRIRFAVLFLSALHLVCSPAFPRRHFSPRSLCQPLLLSAPLISSDVALINVFIKSCSRYSLQLKQWSLQTPTLSLFVSPRPVPEPGRENVAAVFGRINASWNTTGSFEISFSFEYLCTCTHTHTEV